MLEPVEKADTGKIAGRYRSNATGTDIAISSDGPHLEAVGRFGSATFEIKPVAQGIWHARATGALPMSGILSFDDDGSAFRFSSGRTRALIFRRSR